METDSSSLRPTKAVVEKALRDMVRPVVEGLVVLELFAGTARVSMGLVEEGARQAFAVDQRETPDELPEEIEWFQRDVDAFLNHGPPEPVGLVYLDPPYETDRYVDLVETVSEADWLEPNGLIAVETAWYTDLSEHSDRWNNLSLKRNRRYGGTRLWIFQEESDS